MVPPQRESCHATRVVRWNIAVVTCRKEGGKFTVGTEPLSCRTGGNGLRASRYSVGRLPPERNLSRTLRHRCS